MSSEQCRGEELDARSDVYSLGVMFYEMISGLRPFNAPTPTGVIARQLTALPPPLHPTLRVPNSVEAILMRSLAKDPQARQADASAFMRELECAMQQSRATAQQNNAALNRSPNFSPAPPQPFSPALRISFIAAITLFCLIAVAMSLWSFSTRASKAQRVQATRQVEQPVISATPAINTPIPKKRKANVSDGAIPGSEIRTRTIRPETSTESHKTKIRTLSEGLARAPQQKKRIRSNGDGRDEIEDLAPLIEFIEIRPITKSSTTSGKKQSRQPDISEMPQFGKGRTVTTRFPDGSVRTIYVAGNDK